jgi:hypothetical protein
MTDLEQRFRSTDRLHAPDLRSDIRQREPRPPRREIPWGRLGTAALALAVAAAGIAFAASAFLGNQERSSPRQTPVSVPVDPQVTATVSVGSFPRSIAAGFGSVWVTMPKDDSSGGVVKRIDPAKNEVVAEIPIEEAGEIASGSGSVWVAAVTNSVGPQGETSDFGGVVYRIDPATDQIVGEIPFEGGLIYDIAADDTGVWLAQATGNRTGAVLRVDPGTSEVVATIPVDDVPYSLVTGEGFVWALLGPRGLVKIDPSTNDVVATIDANPVPFEMAVGEGAVWVQSWLSAHDPTINTGSEDRPVIIRVDAGTNEIGPPIDYDDGFYPVAVTHGGVWFMGGHLGKGPDQVVARLNTKSLEVDASVSLPPEDHESRNFLAFEESSGSIWIANYRDTVTRVDLLPPG